MKRNAKSGADYAVAPTAEVKHQEPAYGGHISEMSAPNYTGELSATTDHRYEMPAESKSSAAGRYS